MCFVPLLILMCLVYYLIKRHNKMQACFVFRNNLGLVGYACTLFMQSMFMIVVLIDIHTLGLYY